MDEVQELVNKLNKYRQDYYTGSSSIDDEEFDFLEKELKTLDPDNPYFDQIGTKNKVTGVIEVEHKIPMMSMDKVQTAEAAQKWIDEMSKYCDTSVILCDPKLDGISGKLVYDQDGKFSFASTRGDGLIGQIIPFANRIEGVVPEFIPNCELRGEFIIPKKYKDKIKGALRNICNGFMKRKEWTPEVDYVNFVVYDVNFYEKPYKFKNKSDKFQFIINYIPNWYKDRFHIVDIYETSDISKFYNLYINKYRDQWPYETDGIIMTVNGDQEIYNYIDSNYKISTFHRYNKALKPPANFAQSEIIDIESSVNRQKVSFVAIINPVTLMDVHVSRATLDNWTNIKKNKIGIGTSILVKRTNDVIPKIVKTFNEPGKQIKFINITHCPCCEQPLSNVYQDLVCTNEYGCKDIFSSKVENLINVCEIKNFGPVIIKAIVDQMESDGLEYTFNNFFKQIIPDNNGNYLYKNFIEAYYNGGKRPIIFEEAVRNLLENITELKFLGGANIPNIGIQTLINHKILDYDKLVKYFHCSELKVVIDSEFENIIYNWFRSKKNEDIFETISLLKSNGYLQKTDIEDSSNKISYCISGEVPGFKSKGEFIQYLKEKKPELMNVSSVTTNTNYLISSESGTSKVLKAKRYGIPILNSSEFLSRFGIK